MNEVLVLSASAGAPASPLEALVARVTDATTSIKAMRSAIEPHIQAGRELRESINKMQQCLREIRAPLIESRNQIRLMRNSLSSLDREAGQLGIRREASWDEVRNIRDVLASAMLSLGEFMDVLPCGPWDERP